jgi:PIN domain nuclease of toxin-antitoxin system
MALKLDKLGIVDEFETLLDRAVNTLRLSILAVDLRHIVQSGLLPFHHRDPFDRIIVAQAIIEGLPILTSDTQIAKYPVRVIW